MIFDNEIKKELEEAWLVEMAVPRAKAKAVCESLSFNFLVHVAKCFLFKDTEWYNHWLTEVANYCVTVGSLTLKPNANKPNKEFYKDYFIDEIENAADAKIYLNVAIDKCEEVKRGNATNDEAFKFIDLWQELRESLAEALSSKEEYKKDFYKNLIDNFIKSNTLSGIQRDTNV